ncbi:hypothetical protein OJ997_03540 [Solirubrobacter phytolaccae]|uniref:Uncharacterized protein n=1 Tax=Solirubrobacter phytolaccae TaxID=1404360 RepID=A0A9X3S5W6_9ACTN|nr:hypothetical protein [Solirubrobacter phytolaccae]MDA0179359.1 hypothetical protein [Solirubrobacter phytolaccae]
MDRQEAATLLDDLRRACAAEYEDPDDARATALMDSTQELVDRLAPGGWDIERLARPTTALVDHLVPLRMGEGVDDAAERTLLDELTRLREEVGGAADVDPFLVAMLADLIQEAWGQTSNPRWYAGEQREQTIRSFAAVSEAAVAVVSD